VTGRIQTILNTAFSVFVVVNVVLLRLKCASFILKIKVIDQKVTSREGGRFNIMM